MTNPEVDYAPEDCGCCRGRGRILWKMCPVCSGQGSVLVAQPAKKCATCRGKGRIITEFCPACDGSGWAHSLIQHNE
jgi:DnaJ-class molecular chaperone